MKATVEMKVTVTVDVPDGVDVTDERIVDIAMASVIQFQDVDCGPTGKIVWAKVYAEVADIDCEIVE